ncbi:hypothetical protein [Agromyces bauzanensis]
MIRLDLASIRGAADDATRIRSAFDASDDTARAAAAASGHDELARTIERFASTWDDRRRGFAEHIGDVAAALDAIERSFADLDRSLAREPGRG